MNQKQENAANKVSRIPVKVDHSKPSPRKPDWIRVKLSSSPKVNQIK
ncbi:MAG: lipoyl synthase, partial [Methylococcales bacterium]|nr:lipoyl synthase [Methylococcales bacterium]